MSNRRKLRLLGAKAKHVHQRCPGCGGGYGPLVHIPGRGLDRLIEHKPDCPYVTKGQPS